MKRKISAVLLAALVLGLVTSAASADSSSNNDLSANVTSTVAVDVKPEDLAYPSLSVGELQKTSNRSFPGVEIVNTGSEYIDQVWLETSYPHTRPFGDGSASAHDAGNFMVVKPEDSPNANIQGDKNAYHYVNRKEFSDSDYPNFINTPPTDGSVTINGEPVNNTHVGQIRFGQQWFYYMIPTTTGDQCTGGTNQISRIRVGTVPHTPDQMGTVDFTDDGLDQTTSGQDPAKKWTSVEITQSDSNSAYGVAGDVTFNFKSGVGTYNGSQTYDILTACDGASEFDTNHVVLNKYNIGFNSTVDLAQNGVATTYLLDTTVESSMLAPSQSFSLKTGMRVPRGTTAGQVDPGTLTVFANADKSQT